jgi:hypothetical protein
MRKPHKGLDYAVDDAAGDQHVFHRFKEAAGFAVSLAASGREVHLDVLCYSVAGAAAWGGDDAVESYQEDPDCSVLERIVIRAESIGRVA